MAPAGSRVFHHLVPRKLFHLDVQGKRKLSLLPIAFFNRSPTAAAPRANRFAFRPQAIYCLSVAGKTTASLQEDIPGRCMGVCHTAPRERDKYSRSVPGSWLYTQTRKEHVRRRYISRAPASNPAKRGRPTHRQR